MIATHEAIEKGLPVRNTETQYGVPRTTLQNRAGQSSSQKESWSWCQQKKRNCHWFWWTFLKQDMAKYKSRVLPVTKESSMEDIVWVVGALYEEIAQLSLHKGDLIYAWTVSILKLCPLVVKWTLRGNTLLMRQRSMPLDHCPVTQRGHKIMCDTTHKLQPLDTAF